MHYLTNATRLFLRLSENRTKAISLKNIESILFVTYHFPPEVGGIQTRISNYLKNLSRRGVASVVFVVASRGNVMPSFASNEVTIISCRGGTKFLLQNTRMAVRTVGSASIDVVHVLTGASTLFGLTMVALGRLLQRPTAVSFFGREDFRSPSRLGRIILTLSASLATSISTNSKATMSYLPPILRNKTTILTGGSEITNLPSTIAKNSQSVLFVGRLVKRKGVDDLLRAFAVVRKQVEGARLVVVGEGPESEPLRSLALELGLAKDVEFKGRLMGELLGVEYASSSLCVLPSKKAADDPANEGLGLVLIEASMYGKPLVGTTHGGIPEVISDGVNGLLVPEGDYQALARAIFKLLTDEGLAREIGENALKIAKANFTWEAATDRLLASYVCPPGTKGAS